jgi:hypothetical protein
LAALVQSQALTALSWWNNNSQQAGECFATSGHGSSDAPGSHPAHHHEHDHQAVPSDAALRVKALDSLLVEKGLVDRAALDALVDAYEHKIGPRNGARVVARAWSDPAYKQRLLSNADAAIAELVTAGHKANAWW